MFGGNTYMKESDKESYIILEVSTYISLYVLNVLAFVVLLAYGHIMPAIVVGGILFLTIIATYNDIKPKLKYLITMIHKH